jgi:hypothetical protein
VSPRAILRRRESLLEQPCSHCFAFLWFQFTVRVEVELAAQLFTTHRPLVTALLHKSMGLAPLHVVQRSVAVSVELLNQEVRIAGAFAPATVESPSEIVPLLRRQQINKPAEVSGRQLAATRDQFRLPGHELLKGGGINGFGGERIADGLPDLPQFLTHHASLATETVSEFSKSLRLPIVKTQFMRDPSKFRHGVSLGRLPERTDQKEHVEYE